VTLEDNEPRGGSWRDSPRMSAEANKALVERLVEEAINSCRLEVVDELAGGELAAAAKRWIGPFRMSFPDFEMEIVELIADEQRVVGHFRCSGTHRGEWNGIAATGRRFENVDEIYIFHVVDGKLAGFTAVEDNLSRLRQLGFELRAT
jgi:predicted ester cyclase